METLTSMLLPFYGALLAAMLVYSTNTLVLVLIHWWTGGRPAPAEPMQGTPPMVTVQLPVFNEESVIERLLVAVSQLEWPKDRLEIQLLDDSTDGTARVAAQVVARLQGQGLQISHLRRTDRKGFKAGALAEGLRTAKGEFIAVFDADFVPPPGFLKGALPRFSDSDVAAVQGRWTHLNREWSALTRAQALAIDGHFGVEQGARCQAGWFLNFNGTAGVWRRSAIDDAGGWTADTLTEDLDLSYRVQLRGWRLIYDPDLVCPAELPIHLAAFKSQQRRWATGSMQCARKLLPAVWRSEASLLAKVQATLHLTHYAVHPLLAASAILALPCVLSPGAEVGPFSPWSLLIAFALALCGPTILHVYAQRVLEGRIVPVRDMLMLTVYGIGIAISNTQAVFAAFRGPGGTFVRTPKVGVINRTDPVGAYRARPDGLRNVEIAVAAYCLGTAVIFAWVGLFEIAPFFVLDAAGFAVVGAVGWAEARV